jgi:uncharacterized protein YjbI with pentapeptide repeats
MGNGTIENPFVRKDVLNLVRKNGGKAEGLNLSNRRFVEEIDLSGLDLQGIILNEVSLFRVNFNGSTLDRAIMQKANLSHATFNSLGSKIASLQGIDLRNANLQDAEFKGANLSAAQFQETRFSGTVFPSELQDKVLELLPAFLVRTNFTCANLFLANFTGCYFYGTKFEGAFIHGADIFEAHLDEVDWGNYIIGEESKKEELHFAEIIYRRLKLWFRARGMYDVEAKFYYREKESRRKTLKLCSKQWNNRLAADFTRVLFGYGEHWERVVLWIIGFILFFALLYFIIGTLNPNSFFNCLYFSSVSFIALGYGNWVKEVSGLVKPFGVLETFIGFFMMTLLLVTFVRKWTR